MQLMNGDPQMKLALSMMAALLSAEPVNESFSRPRTAAETIRRSQSFAFGDHRVYTQSVGRWDTIIAGSNAVGTENKSRSGFRQADLITDNRAPVTRQIGEGSPFDSYTPSGPPVAMLTARYAPNEPGTTGGLVNGSSLVGLRSQPPPTIDPILNVPIFPKYIEGTFHNGGTRQFSGLGLFVPILEHPDRLLFADLRGKLGDDSTAEGNWGLGYRRILPSGWIAGLYGFWDLRHTEHDNNLNQVTLGAELLDLNWDLRLNAYIPEGGAKEVSGMNRLFSTGGTIMVRRGEERVYHGLDGEIGALLSRFSGANYDAELRGFVGGFWFDNDAEGFPEIAGPRVRLELRLFDLPWFGIDSRLALGGEVQNDDVRGTQAIGTISLSIPLGPAARKRGRRLSLLERRMVNPIRRDIDVVTNIGLGQPRFLRDRDRRRGRR